MTRTTCARLSRVLAILVSSALVACSGSTGDDDVGDDDINQEPLCELTPMTNGVSTVTGCAEAGMTDGIRAGALFDDPVNVAVGPDGKLYVTDFNNSRIRVIDQEGLTRTFTAQPDFHKPFGLVFAPNGTLYASTDRDETGGGGGDVNIGIIWRVANDGQATKLATNTGRARGMVVLGNGTLVVADFERHVVRIFDPNSRQFTTTFGALGQPGIADGPAATARFNSPYDVADMGDGTVLVTDFDNHRIRRIALSAATVSTVTGGAAGNANGALATATFRNPQGIAVSDDDSIYITDTGNFLVRRIRAGQVTTVAGNGSGTYVDSENPLSAGIYGMEGIDTAGDGVLYVTDGDRGTGTQPHHRIRRIMVD